METLGFIQETYVNSCITMLDYVLWTEALSSSKFELFHLIDKMSVLLVAADQSRIMQDQMTGAAMAMPPDPNKAFKVTNC